MKAIIDIAKIKVHMEHTQLSAFFMYSNLLLLSFSISLLSSLFEVITYHYSRELKRGEYA